MATNWKVESGQANGIVTKKQKQGTSLVVQWLRLHAPNTGSQGSVLGQGTRSRMPRERLRVKQLRHGTAKLKKTKTWRLQPCDTLKLFWCEVCVCVCEGVAETDR